MNGSKVSVPPVFSAKDGYDASTARTRLCQAHHPNLKTKIVPGSAGKMGMGIVSVVPGCVNAVISNHLTAQDASAQKNLRNCPSGLPSA